MSNFDIGNIVRLSVAFTDSNNAPVDPGAISLNIRPISTYTYVDNDIIRDGAGLYHYDYTPSAPGLYYYRYIGTDGATAASDGQFGITASQATDPWPQGLTPCC